MIFWLLIIIVVLCVLNCGGGSTYIVYPGDEIEYHRGMDDYDFRAEYNPYD